MSTKTKYELTEAESRIYKAMSQMPGGAMDPLKSAADKVRDAGRAGFNLVHAPLRMEDLAGYLEACKAVLAELFDEKRELEAQVRDLRAQVKAVELVGEILSRGMRKE